MSNIEKAAEIIAEARRTAPRVRDMKDHISPHIAQALSDAGLLAPDLPVPETCENVSVWETLHTSHRYEGTEIEHEMHTTISCVDPDLVWMETARADEDMSADKARSVALALLAAANYAETEKPGEQST